MGNVGQEDQAMQSPRQIANVLLIVTALLLVVRPAQSQTEPAETSGPTAPAAEPSELSDAAKAKKVFNRTVAKYRSLRSYQHKSKTKFEIETDGSMPFGMGMNQEKEGTLKFARPNRIAMVTEQMEVFSDGRQMWTIMKMFGQYTEREATDPLDVEIENFSPWGMSSADPIAVILAQHDKTIAAALPMIEEFSRVKDEERNGKKGRSVCGTLQMQMCPDDHPAEFCAWINGKTLLIEEVKIDLTAAYEFMMSSASEQNEDDSLGFEMPIIEKAEFVMTFTDIKINEEIPAAQFVHTPGRFEEKVESFDFLTAVDFEMDEDFEAEESSEPVHIDIEELGVERLAELPKINGNFSGHQARIIDIDRDGVLELLLPEWQGRVSVLDINGEVIERVRLKGTRGASIGSVEPVQIDGQTQWLASFTQHIGRSMSQKSFVGLFDSEGEEVWVYEPDLPSGASATLTVSSGDLTGDGNPEFVVGVSAYVARQTGKNTWMHDDTKAYIMVFDRKGEPIVVRHVGQHMGFLHVIEGLSSDQPATILFIGATGQLQRFRLGADR